MENKELIQANIINNYKEVVKNLTPQETALNYAIVNKLDDLKKALKERLLISPANKYQVLLSNGEKIEISVVRTPARTTPQIIRDINWEKAIRFAKEHNYEIPMTEPQYDLAKIEAQNWFQQNIEQFVSERTIEKETKATNSIRVKEID